MHVSVFFFAIYMCIWSIRANLYIQGKKGLKKHSLRGNFLESNNLIKITLVCNNELSIG